MSEALVETIITDPVTGGQKGSKLPQLGAIEPLAILEVAKVAGYGATKYARYNYLRGYRWSLSFDALQRHLLLFWSGEDRDQESGLYHLAHAAWHCLALLSFKLFNLGEDDRWTYSLPASSQAESETLSSPAVITQSAVTSSIQTVPDPTSKETSEMLTSPSTTS